VLELTGASSATTTMEAATREATTKTGAASETAAATKAAHRTASNAVGVGNQPGRVNGRSAGSVAWTKVMVQRSQEEA
jgi:hypothetical protein